MHCFFRTKIATTEKKPQYQLQNVSIEHPGQCFYLLLTWAQQCKTMHLFQTNVNYTEQQCIQYTLYFFIIMV